jgi:hypothetical protein
MHHRKWLIVPSVAAALLTSLAACSHPSDTARSSRSTSVSEQDGCRFATADEIAEASGIPVKQSTDMATVHMNNPGCYYTDAPLTSKQPRAAVTLQLFGDLWDAEMAKIAADPHAVVEDVPGLGQQAKYVTATNPAQHQGQLWVKANSTQGFSVGLSAENNNQQPEVAVAKLVLSRIENG